MRKLIPIGFVIFLTHTACAQQSGQEKSGTEDKAKLSENEFNPRKDRRFGISVNGGGPAILASVSLDYFIAPRLNIEAGVGLPGSYLGMNYFIKTRKAKQNWLPYVGLHGFYILDVIDVNENKGLYIPLGMHYMSDKGFTFAMELAVVTGDIPFYGAIKLGYHL